MSLKTKKTSIRKKLICFVLAFVCAFSVIMPYYSPIASADETLEDLENQYKEIEDRIEKNEKELANVEKDIRTNEDKLEDLESQISDINDQIDLLDERMDVLNGDIDSLQESIDLTTSDINVINSQIAEIEAQIAETDALMDETREMLLLRIRESYMSGEASTLELLFSSGDISSFFARKELVTRVSEEDSLLIAELTAKVAQLDELQTQLETQKTELETKKTQLDSQMDTLNDRQSDLESSITTQQGKKSEATKKQDEVKYLLTELDKDSEAYKKTIARQRKEREALEAEIDEYIRKHGSTQGDTPDEEYNNDGDMLWPVAGETRLTATYPSYSDGSPHWGIDIVKSDGNTRGQPFRAAQGGEVIIAKNDGNWNSGFGNYCVVDHGDGTQTLYAHSDGLVVKEGQIVQKGEKLGAIGATGNVTGPHLHFEVRVKKADGSVSRVNPLNYVSKP